MMHAGPNDQMILPDGYASLMMVSFCSWLEMIAVPWSVKNASSGK